MRFGHNRDGKRGRTIVVYGVLADVAGRALALEAYPGDTGDPTTVSDQVDKLRQRFGLRNLVPGRRPWDVDENPDQQSQAISRTGLDLGTAPW